MKKRGYKITFGLQEGYEKDAKIHTLPEAERVIKEWMLDRLQNDFPIVTGLLQGGTLFYPSVGDEQKGITISHSAIFTGELSSKEDNDRKNKEVRHTLESLAYAIKEKLRQESVYIIYLDENWCV